MVGDIKILQPGYLPKPHKKIHDQQLKIEIEKKGRQARRTNESTYFNRTMVALEQVVGKSKQPWVTLDHAESIIDVTEAPSKKTRVEALQEREAHLDKPRSPSAVEKYDAMIERKAIAE